MVSTWATLMMVGALWMELTVWPSLVTTATTMPSMGETMRVYPRLTRAVSTWISACAICASSEAISARVTASLASAVSKASRELASAASIWRWRLNASSACFSVATLAALRSAGSGRRSRRPVGPS
ncbi:hypothetical protein G6F22_019978 [Rhizopus arrhizus]|nr:hypothetical protein G6F22_019978 [Rhizopus arrhizus]KAG1171524.1 hypothetical protein G6F35_017070 [Rhizopus arrhizus]